METASCNFHHTAHNLLKKDQFNQKRVSTHQGANIWPSKLSNSKAATMLACLKADLCSASLASALLFVEEQGK